MEKHHTLHFETLVQAEDAAYALTQINIIASQTEVRDDDGKPALFFQTAYALGPIMRIVINQQTLPAASFWNRQPGTREKFPLLHRVTLGQVLLTVITLTITSGMQFFGSWNSWDFWDKILMGLLITGLVAWMSNDILGLWKSRDLAPSHQMEDEEEPTHV